MLKRFIITGVMRDYASLLNETDYDEDNNDVYCR